MSSANSPAFLPRAVAVLWLVHLRHPAALAREEVAQAADNDLSNREAAKTAKFISLCEEKTPLESVSQVACCTRISRTDTDFHGFLRFFPCKSVKSAQSVY